MGGGNLVYRSVFRGGGGALCHATPPFLNSAICSKKEQSSWCQVTKICQTLVRVSVAREAKYAKNHFQQNRYSDFVLTAAFLCLLVAVFVLVGSQKIFVYSITSTPPNPE